MTFKKGHKINLGIKRSKEVCEILSISKSGLKNPNWNNGIRKHMSGYIFILHKNHPFCNSKGYIFKHRVVVEQHIGRYLTKIEVVHHINGIKTDNRIENLMCFKNHSAHTTYHNNELLCDTNHIIFDGSKLCQK